METTTVRIKTENPFPCTVCPDTFDSVYAFKRHIRIHSGEKLHDCDLCIATFNTKFALQQHMLIHTGERKYDCKICNYKFQTKTNLTAHVRTRHTEARNYACEICNSKFKTNGILKGHMLTHNTERKRYSCLVCNKDFATRKIVRTHHKRIHKTHDPSQIDLLPEGAQTTKHPQLGSIPIHGCDICPDKLVKNHDIKTHILSTKGGEILYKCLLCNKSLTAKGGLKKHMLIHTGERKYNCQICKNKYKWKRNLQQHMLTHTGERPHKCSICEKSFVRTSNLAQHLMKFHKLKNTKIKNVPGEKQTDCNNSTASNISNSSGKSRSIQY